jgi:uncharacterized protein YyaL (SSP411 family)
MARNLSSLMCFGVFLLLINMKIFSQVSPTWSHFDSDIFEKAKKENKLVLLHLRANWCHWCHVMEEKTYADTQIISFLKENYIACMEDHDERQDLTSLYSEYGWPATIIFDSNGNELFKEAGYIPAEEFLLTLTKLKNDPQPLSRNEVITDLKPSTSDSIKQASLVELKRLFNNSLDTDKGGFVFGQKYIEFATFEYALKHYKADSTLKNWLTASVDNSTGIFDAAWGGVFQYSTNNDWHHVHFEKLLSIQARYIKIYCWYYKLFNDKNALQKAELITAYVDRFLSSTKGGFYNAQDADLIPGEKSKAYFDLSDAERTKKGIPAVDTNVYTSDNAEYAESLIILWGTTGKQNYLDKALKCIDFLNAKRKLKTTYKHGESYTVTISLKDNLAMLKTLMLVYRATQDEKFKTEASYLAKEIADSFNSHKGYLYTYIGNSAIKATYNVTENIEACRLLNYCSYFFHEPAYKQTAEELLQFLTSAELVATLSTEPGILSASEEFSNEPVNAALMLKEGNELKEDYLKAIVAFPYFYFNGCIYTKETAVEDKKGLFDSFNSNFIVLCTSSYCSPPMNNVKEFSNFLYKRVLDGK